MPKRKSNAPIVNQNRQPKPLQFRRREELAPQDTDTTTTLPIPHSPPNTQPISERINFVKEQIKEKLEENEKLKLECNTWHSKYYDSKRALIVALLTIQADLYNVAPIQPVFEVPLPYPLVDVNDDTTNTISIKLPLIMLSELQVQLHTILQENEALKRHVNNLYRDYEIDRLSSWNLLSGFQDSILSQVPAPCEPLPFDRCKYPYPEFAPFTSSSAQARTPVFGLSYFSIYKGKPAQTTQPDAATEFGAPLQRTKRIRISPSNDYGSSF